MKTDSSFLEMIYSKNDKTIIYFDIYSTDCLISEKRR